MSAGPNPAVGPQNRVQCRLATVDDVDAIVAIHKMCFTPATHALMHLGDEFLGTTYRWLTTSPLAFTLVAEKDGAIVGFQSGCDRPYRRALFRDNLGALIVALCKRPWIVARMQILASVWSAVTPTRPRPDHDTSVPAQLVVNGVHPDHRLGFEVANQLFRATLSHGRERGWTWLIGGVYKSNTTILFLSRLHGFKRIEHLDTELLSFVEYRFGTSAKQV
jgi:hypothetical protein